ncbi:hypothetical protein EYF80_013482 [Liparis tanakae]|uniref:Uncharacterized protein n=1 Tax=Liparis tanakae TaxID=230148 RepID=A0A4Z2IFK4_9TELE|nr:hypothetical protein EYF80_013482 [Liparis tanakae]
MSLKKSWSSSRNPRKATRLARTTANTFSPTRRTPAHLSNSARRASRSYRTLSHLPGTTQKR